MYIKNLTASIFAIVKMGKQQGSIEIVDGYGILYLDNSEFYFDTENLPLIKSRSWYKDKDGYLVSCYYYAGRRRFVRFHRIVMNAKENEIIDHINHKRTDNRKCNLRVCKHTENDYNRSLYATNTSGVSGVYYDKKRKKWIANITYNHRRIFIGRFLHKEEAVKARLAKEVELFKDFAPQGALLEV